jgi:hypothetical protein
MSVPSIASSSSFYLNNSNDSSNNSTNSSFSHCTQFMIDLISLKGTPSTLQNFLEVESGYDMVFTKAWGYLIDIKDTPIKTSAALLKVLDKIQELSMSHLPKEDKEGPIQGRAYATNYFPFSKNITSDEQGVKDLIEKIWLNKEDLILSVLDVANSEMSYIVTKESFNREINNAVKMYFPNDNSKESLERIFKIILPLYHQKRPNGLARMLVLNKTNSETREKRAIKYIDTYFQQIATVKESEKIKQNISLLIRDLSQLHLYWDGNGRSLYLLANLLTYQNRMGFFYPNNMCIFECNSVKTMLKEMDEGFERFKKMFETCDRLSTEMYKYQVALSDLFSLLKEAKVPETLNQSFGVRNFNLLLRQTAQKVEYIKVLNYLVQHRPILNINLKSKGEKSGTALDVAVKYQNLAAVSLLKDLLKTKSES